MDKEQNNQNQEPQQESYLDIFLAMYEGGVHSAEIRRFMTQLSFYRMLDGMEEKEAVNLLAMMESTVSETNTFDTFPMSIDAQPIIQHEFMQQENEGVEYNTQRQEDLSMKQSELLINLTRKIQDMSSQMSEIVTTINDLRIDDYFKQAGVKGQFEDTKKRDEKKKDSDNS